MSDAEFDDLFEKLTEKEPFPWQRALYRKFVEGDIPESCNLPTGLGKTSVIAIWLLALLSHPDKMPRRLVYVVNRRTVVDQTTTEVEKLRTNLPNLNGRLTELAISTLRGQYADNREWSADPSRPAVICGTVDMIGSRLLFSGYGVGFKAKPLHAGFLGQDVLLIHDEAHLEPAFQKLLIELKIEQKRCNEFQQFHVMELSATTRAGGEPFVLQSDDYDHPVVAQRINAKKLIAIQENADEKKLADEIAEIALKYKESNVAVVVFVRKVEDVEKVVARLTKEKQLVQSLTGTMRGLERDRLNETTIFQRFLPNPPTGEQTVYLVCTSAGEVGVNISADHLICDLSTFDSMAQRFGRVNRFGFRTDTEIFVVHPKEFDEEDDYQLRLSKTLNLLRELNGDGSPSAIGKLNPEDRVAAFTPEPTMLPTSDILFDAWALTSIRGKMPGRPIVAPYLHGISEYEPPETHVAWREEVGVIAGEVLEKEYPPQSLLEEFPLKPHELLRDRSDRVLKHLTEIAKTHPDAPVWLVDDDGTVKPTTLKFITEKDQKERINYMTVLLPPDVGGLGDAGTLDGKVKANSATSLDVSCKWPNEPDDLRRVRRWDNDTVPVGMRRILRIDTKPDDDSDGESEGRRYWHWFELTKGGDEVGSTAANKPVLLEVHTNDVVKGATEISDNLSLPTEMKKAIRITAKLHDSGKNRRLFQRVLGNGSPNILLAKSGKKGGRMQETYRHEFGSLIDLEGDAEFQGLSDEMKELARHLIAVHHGRGRPHFGEDEAFDPEHPMQIADSIAVEVPIRFAKLQRRYGRWGLAYLESILRAADYAASAKPSKFVEEST